MSEISCSLMQCVIIILGKTVSLLCISITIKEGHQKHSYCIFSVNHPFPDFVLNLFDIPFRS